MSDAAVDVENATGLRESDTERQKSTLALLERSWSEVLTTTAVGPDSDFFALGGDSLAAVRVASMVAAELGADGETEEFVLVALFEEPTLDALARELDRHLRERG